MTDLPLCGKESLSSSLHLCTYTYVGVYICSIERSMDLDTVPKTEKLDTQFVSTRPKMPHNPPSRSHIVSITIYV